MLDQLLALGKQRYVTADLVATVRLALGDKRGALDDFERAAEERSFPLILVGVYPVYNSLANEPRFKALLAKLGLPPPAT